MTNIMIEQVADAIVEITSERDATFILTGITVDDLARAAIEAMQAPTDAMVRAACRVSVSLPEEAPDYDRDLSDTEARECWQAMVAAALAG